MHMMNTGTISVIQSYKNFLTKKAITQALKKWIQVMIAAMEQKKIPTKEVIQFLKQNGASPDKIREYITEAGVDPV